MVPAGPSWVSLLILLDLYRLNVDSNCAEHVDGAESQRQRSGNTDEGNVDQGAVQCEPPEQDKAEEHESEADKELGAFADCREEGAAWSVPLSGERGIHTEV